MRISKQLIPEQIIINQKQLKVVEYFKYLGRIIKMISDVSVKLSLRFPRTNQHSTGRWALLPGNSASHLRKKSGNRYFWNIALYHEWKRTRQKVEQKYVESLEMWCWSRMEKINWSDHVRNEVLQRAKKERNILLTINRRKANWIGHILRRKCFLKYIILLKGK
jgi:hypothetical protein